MIPEMYIKGTQVNYYFVCKTKLWLFSHNIAMEQESDEVKLGKLLHKEVFNREEKDVQLGSIAIDVVSRKNGIEIREIKKSKKVEKAHYYQTLYYLLYLKRLGIDAKANIVYPKLKESVKVELDHDSEVFLSEVVENVDRIISGEMPLPEYKKICKRCAYFEFCFC